MVFRTQIPLQKARNQIAYESNVLLMGSCFASNIGNKLLHFKFPAVVNPFGILFHPKAIEKLFLKAINQETYTSNDLFNYNNLWHCFDVHSEWSHVSERKLLQNLNKAVRDTHDQIKKSTHIVITFGTSWVYRFIESDTLVANCHKVPQKKFLKELLSVDEISECVEAIVNLLRNISDQIKVIFTISPIRHLKDGFVENSLSKANLLAGIHQSLAPGTLHNDVNYFPSYEIMMDDLRDYRFYENDMLHPNETAINYIWDNFKNTWIDQNSFDMMKEIDSIQRGLAHKPFHSESKEHQQFLSELNRKIAAIENQFPQIKFQ